MVLRFRTRVFVSILSVVLLAGGLMALAVNRTVTHAMGSEYKTRGQVLAVNLAARCQDPLLAVDFLRLKDMVDEAVRSSDGMAYAFIMDRRGEVLVHTFNDGFPTALKTANLAGPGQRCAIRLLDTGNRRIYDFAAPVLADADRVGMVRLGLSRQQAVLTIRRVLGDAFAQLALALFIAAIVGFRLSENVTRRLSHLRKALSRVNAGDLDTRVGPPITAACWQVKACGRSDCPLHGDFTRRCWVARAWRDGNEGDTEAQVATCQSCGYYQRHCGDEIQHLGESFDAMLHSLKRSLAELAQSRNILEASERKYRRIYQNSMDMIFMADGNGKLNDTNPAGKALLGLDRHDTSGDLPSLDKIFASGEDFRKLVEEMRRNGFVRDRESIWCTRDKVYKEVLFSCSLQRDEAENSLALEGIVKDISLRRAIEKQLLRADRLASLGQLSAGVAHEINNPLGLILGYAGLLWREAPSGSQQRADLEIIKEEALKCKNIVQALLNFARKTETRLAPVRLSELIEEVAAIVRHDFEMAHITLEIDTSVPVPEVFGDADKLRQVIVNLLINARQAVAADGRVRAATLRWPDRAMVGLVVEDNGPGIAAEHLERVFDPFFTTKPVGQGTGLGLSVSYGIVQEHGGRILVTSRPDQMTAFTVELPQAPDTPLKESGGR